MYYCLTHGYFPTNSCILVNGQSAYEYAGELYQTCDAYDVAYAYEQMLDDREKEKKMKENSVESDDTYDYFLNRLIEETTDRMLKRVREEKIHEELAKGGKIINLKAIVYGDWEDLDELPFP